MRTIWRSADRDLLRDAGAIAVAVVVIGVSFGAIAVASGLPGWLVVAMSLLVFAGGAQFLSVGLLAAGGPLAAVLGGLLLNARHVPFGLALASERSSEASDAVGGSGSERSSEASDAVGGSGSERSSEASDAVGGS
ncbi:MAG: branched-chain amino acid ABC transporter permease, partial [Micromonosporaceae bacterium]|nr:branched-chain amino acid ABC transporter permease [Micromonosporaceae bacterium]